jgi:two-component system sensor histidine kinase KdpD
MRPRWQEWLSGSVVDQIVRLSGVIDVCVVSSIEAESESAKQSVTERSWFPHRPYRRYLLSAGLVLLATLLSFLVDPVLTLEKWNLGVESLLSGTRPLRDMPPPVFDPTNLVMIFLTGVVIAALYLGRGPAILTSILSVVAFDLFFVEPYLTFAVSDTQYLITFVSLFVVGLVISSLAARAQEQTEAARAREVQTGELYDLSRDLASAAALDAILQVLIRHVEQIFGREVVVLLPTATDSKHLEPRAASANLKLDEQEQAVADWVFQHGESAGRGTNTLGAARLRYLPLKTARGVVGVLGVMRPADSEHLSPEQHRLMEAFGSQSAVAIERANLDTQARQAEILQVTEKLQSALLNSISHDLRTPLVSITGALSSLEDDRAHLDDEMRLRLVRNARGEAERLNRLVGNLLDMTRLEAGALKLKQEPGDIQDAIGAALNQLGGRVEGRHIAIDVADDVPLVEMDFVMIVQVLVNLLDNALKYSPPETVIDVQGRVASGHLEVSVGDRGIGIPPEDLQHVFDKSFRVQHPGSVSGTGLGLSICKGLVEAHGGFIAAENRLGGGTVVTFALPINE